MHQPGRTTACSRRPPASARTSLPAATETQRWGAVGHIPLGRKPSGMDNCSAKHLLCALGSPYSISAFPPLALGVPRPVQRLQPLDPTAHRPLRVAPQAGLWPEPTRGRTLAATPCGGRHPWPPQKLALKATSALACTLHLLCHRLNLLTTHRLVHRRFTKRARHLHKPFALFLC